MKRIVFRGMEHDTVLEDHVNKEFARIENFLAHDRLPQYIHIILEYHPSHAHNKVEIRIKTPSYEVFVSDEDQNMNKLIDQVCDTVYLELHKQKEKLVDRDKKGCVEDCTGLIERQLDKYKK